MARDFYCISTLRNEFWKAAPSIYGWRAITCTGTGMGAATIFERVPLGGDRYAFRNGEGYVTDAGDMITVDTPTVGDAQSFLEIALGDNSALQSYTGKFVCAEGGGGGEVLANRDQIGEWETWRYVIPPRELVEQLYPGAFDDPDVGKILNEESIMGQRGRAIKNAAAGQFISGADVTRSAEAVREAAIRDGVRTKPGDAPDLGGLVR